MPTGIDELTINLLNIDLEDPNNQCMICHESLCSAQKYKLPECGHEYHTHCAISWFRNGDSRCPYCGNRGINNNQVSETNSRRLSCYAYRFREHEGKFNELKKYSKKPDANKILVKEFKKLEQLNKTLEEKQENMKEFRTKINNELVNYKKIDKERRSLRNKIWTARQAIMKKKQTIIDLHIVPLIIPLPLDIN